MRIVNPIAVLGEDIACEYLKKKGYKIIERNFRKKYQEIDIIAICGSILVFVEVKTRRTNSYGTPFESITPRKLRNLVKLSQLYKLMHPHFPDYMRIDAIGVTLSWDKNIEKVEHIENITDYSLVK